MSFDLYFCISSGATFDASRVYDFFSAESNYRMHGSPEASFQAWYQNDATGVYCSFDYASEPVDPEETRVLAPGYTDTGLSFNLNYFRPSFFSHESMPIVERIARKFNLWVLDPQESDGESGIPTQCRADQLVASWEKHNDSSIPCVLRGKGVEDTDYVYYPRDRSMYWWAYARSLAGLQEKLGPNFFVPSIFLLRKGKEPKLCSFVIWSDALPQVFPTCDVVVKQVMKKNWRGKMVSKRMEAIPFKEAMESLRHLLRPLDGSVAELKVLPADRARDVRGAFDSLTGPIFRPQDYKACGSGEFVDVLVPERLTPAS